MSLISAIFNSGRLGLFANREALTITSQNIANLNTPGYTRIDAILGTSSPIHRVAGQIGSGVQVIEARYAVNNFLEKQVTAQNSTLGRLQAGQTALSRIDGLFTDLQGSGVSQALADFFGAFNDLAGNPTSIAQREALVAKASTLATRVNAVETQLHNIALDNDAQITGIVRDINRLAVQIAQLNGQISNAEVGGQVAGDLRDQRRRLLNELAKHIDIIEFEGIQNLEEVPPGEGVEGAIDGQGVMTVMVGGGKPLVEGTRANALRVVPNIANRGQMDIAFDTGTGELAVFTSAITNGELKGLLDSRDGLVTQTIAEVNLLSQAIITEVNAQHRLGVDLYGNDGLDFFEATVFTPGVPNIGSLRVADGILADPNTVATALPEPVDPFAPLPPHPVIHPPALGDPAGSGNDNALTLAKLGEKQVASLGNQTFAAYYSNILSSIGTRSQTGGNALEAEQVVADQLFKLRESESGVSLDEETTKLLQYQRAYEAAARLITVADELTLSILDMKVRI